MSVEILERPTNEEIESAWGMELVFDLTGCDPATIRSKRELRRFSRELCKVIDMKRYRAPVIFPLSLLFLPRRRAKRFALDNPKTAGFTLSQLIYTSNVTIHFAEGGDHFAEAGDHAGSAFGNVFSCKKFDVDKAIAFIKAFFGATGVEARVLIRGRKR